MLDNTSRYIYEIYRLKSVSLAAKKLYLSQPALSSSVKKAEKELGYEIFNRKTIPFSLTPKGKIYMDALEKIINIEEQTKVRIGDMDETESGTLRIAIGGHVAHFAIPKICNLFRKKHPNIDVSIEVCNNDEMEQHLKKDLTDLVFTSTDLNEKIFNTVHLFKENYVVAMGRDSQIPDSLLPYAVTHDELMNYNYPEEKKIKDMSVFHGIEFVYSPPNSNIYRKRKLVLGQPNVSSHVTSSTIIMQLSYNLAKAGFGAFFATDAILAAMQSDEQCLYFVIEDSGVRQCFNAVYNMENKESLSLTEDFIECARSFFDTDNPLLELSK